MGEHSSGLERCRSQIGTICIVDQTLRARAGELETRLICDEVADDGIALSAAFCSADATAAACHAMIGTSRLQLDSKLMSHIM